MAKGDGYHRTARKLLHIAGAAPSLFIHIWPYYIFLAIVSAGLALTYVLKPHHSRLLRLLSKPRDRKLGIITGFRVYMSAMLLLVLLWPALALVEPHAASYIMFGWLALALGDGLAGILGPGPKVARTVPWNKRKTWLGLMGGFVGVLASYIISFILLDPNPSLAPPITQGICAVSIAALVGLLETAEFRIDDNYLVGFGAPVLAALAHWILKIS